MVRPRKVPERLFLRPGRSPLVAYGLSREVFTDLYHLWLTTSWPRLLGAVTAVYAVLNAVFATAYVLVGGVENARPGSFSDAYFFSVQTLATIGYGRMVPLSLGAHLLVTVESFLGLLAVAMATGLLFAKFARPTARVLWSNVAVISPRDGVPSLHFRMANQRANLIVEAQLRVSFLRTERTAEGETVRRVHDVPLVRSQSPFFTLTWTAIHPIVPGSILHGETEESLRASGGELLISLVGLDETFNQTIHARHAYLAADIVWNARFADVLGTLPDGREGVDYTRFHDIQPVAGGAREPSRS